jgi:hypothetical protein
LMFGLISLVAGPVIGVVIAGLNHAIQGLEPIDLPAHYGSIVAIGTVGGIMVAVAFGISCLFTLRAGEPATRDSEPRPEVAGRDEREDSL